MIETLHTEARVPQLIKDYLEESQGLSSFYSYRPSMKGLQMAAKDRTAFKIDRATLVDVLTEQAKASKYCGSFTLEQIEALRSEDVFTLTTGHQLCVYGSPMFFIYKLISVIKLSQQCREEGIATVPIFWMASEDHDFDEVNHVFTKEHRVNWLPEQTGPVGRLHLNSMDEFKKELRAIYNNDPGFTPTMDKLEELFDGSKRLSEAIRDLVYLLFSDHGLVVLDADDHRLKGAFKEVVKNDLTQHKNNDLVEEQSDQLRKLGHHAQVYPRSINLFYLEDGYRERIEHHPDGFQTSDGKHVWSKDVLLTLVDDHPERFSPNVVLRPVYQESILPNLAYIGGPGELSYWLQLKAAFDYNKVFFPVLVLRDMAVWLDEKMSKRMDQLGLKTDQLFNEYEALFKQLLRKEGTHEYIVEEVEEKLEAIFQKLHEDLRAFDAPLGESAKAEMVRIQKRLEHLRKKVLRTDKKANQVLERRLSELKREVHPNGIPQERYYNWLHFRTLEAMKDWIDVLLEQFDPINSRLHVFREKK